MQGTLIRKKFNGEFRNLRGNSLSVCVATLLSYVTQIGACIVLGAFVLSLPENSLALIMLPMLCFFIGTRLRGLNNIVHECSHLSFCADRAENWWLGRLTASFLLKSFAAYRLEHMSHHAHLGDYERDEDFKVIERFQLEAPLTPLTILRHIVTPFTGLHVLYYFSTNMSKDDGAQYALLKWALVAGAAIGLAIAPVTTLVMVVVPFVVVYPAINYWTDCIDHGGLVSNEDELFASRNLIVPGWVRFIVFPRNDCFHLIHHLFPTVPADHLDYCHERLLGDPAYRERHARAVAAGDVSPLGAEITPARV